jgi:hypothetical protein
MALPRIHNRGKRPSDGVYLSLDLDVSICGYLRFGKGLPSDHPLLWLDIVAAYFLGRDLDLIIKVAARRLKCNGPRRKKKYEAGMRVADVWRLASLHKLIRNAKDKEGKPVISIHKFSGSLLTSSDTIRLARVWHRGSWFVFRGVIMSVGCKTEGNE